MATEKRKTADDRPRYTEDAIRDAMSRDTLNRPPEEPPTIKIKLTRRTVAKARDFLWRLFG
jgi:hypothetical protein